MPQLNRRWAIIFLGLVLAFSLALGASAQESNQPAGDIVFIIDESGSMFNDAAVIQKNLQAIVDTLQGRINYQLALVGFGAFKGHSDTEFEGQPHAHSELTNDVAEFRRALDDFVTVGQLEPGFQATQFAMNADLGYRPNAKACAVLISDEGADIYKEAPTTKAEALQALERRSAPLIGIVNWGNTVDPGFQVDGRDYGPTPGGLIPEADGKAFNIVKFRNDPTPVLRTVMEDCITAIQTGSLKEAPQPELPGGSAEEQPTPETQLMLERLRQQVESNTSQIFQLRNQVKSTSRELSSLRTTVSQLADRVSSQVTAQIDSIQQSVQQVSTRVDELRARVDQLQRQLKKRPDSGELNTMQSRLSDLEEQLQRVVGDLQERPALAERVTQLEREVAALGEQTMSVEIRQEVESLRQRFQSSLAETRSSLNVIDQRLTGISDTVAELGRTQQDQSARLDELNAQLSDVRSRLGRLPIDSLQERVTALAERLSSAAQAIGQLQSHDQQTDRRLSALENELSSLPTNVVQRSSLDELNQHLSGRLDELTNRIEANEAAMGELEKQVQETQSIGEKFMDNFAKVMDRLDGLRADLERLKTQSPSVTPEDLAALGDRVAGNESTIGQLNDDVAALQERLSGLSDRLDARAAELKSAIRDLQSQYGQLSEAFESSNANISERLNSLANRQDQVESQLGQLRDRAGQMEQLRPQLNQLQQRLDDLEPRVSANEDGVGTNADAIAKLQDRVGQLETTVDDQLTSVDERLGKLEGQLADQNQAIKDLRSRLDGLQSTVEQNVVDKLRQEGGVVRVEVQEDLLTRRLAQIALAFSLASIGIAWFLFMNR
ncbi:MAG: VWA domain-containing protein [Salinibacter sp.]